MKERTNKGKEEGRKEESKKVRKQKSKKARKETSRPKASNGQRFPDDDDDDVNNNLGYPLQLPEASAITILK